MAEENKEKLEKDVKVEGTEKESKEKNNEVVPKQDYDELDDRYKRI